MQYYVSSLKNYKGIVCAFFLVCLSFFSGCANYKTCTSNTDCASDQGCVFPTQNQKEGFCSKRCTTDAECELVSCPEMQVIPNKHGTCVKSDDNRNNKQSLCYVLDRSAYSVQECTSKTPAKPGSSTSTTQAPECTSDSQCSGCHRCSSGSCSPCAVSPRDGHCMC